MNKHSFLLFVDLQKRGQKQPVTTTTTTQKDVIKKARTKTNSLASSLLGYMLLYLYNHVPFSFRRFVSSTDSFFLLYLYVLFFCCSEVSFFCNRAFFPFIAIWAIKIPRERSIIQRLRLDYGIPQRLTFETFCCLY